jgi:hypothetical protein
MQDDLCQRAETLLFQELDYDEFKLAMKRLGLGLTEEQVAQCIEALDVDKDGSVSLEEFMVLVSKPQKKVVSAMAAIGAFRAMGGDGSQSARDAPADPTEDRPRAEPRPPLSARAQQQQRERGFSHVVSRNRAMNVGSGGRTVWGRSGNDPSGFITDAVEEYNRKGKEKGKSVSWLPPIDRSASPRQGSSRAMGNAKAKPAEYLHSFPDYIMDPEPASRKFNRYYPHDLPMPPTHRATVLATQGPGFAATTNIRSYTKGSNRLPVSGKIPISEEAVKDLENENKRLKGLLGRMMEVEQETDRQLSQKEEEMNVMRAKLKKALEKARVGKQQEKEARSLVNANARLRQELQQAQSSAKAARAEAEAARADAKAARADLQRSLQLMLPGEDAVDTELAPVKEPQTLVEPPVELEPAPEPEPAPESELAPEPTEPESESEQAPNLDAESERGPNPEPEPAEPELDSEQVLNLETGPEQELSPEPKQQSESETKPEGGAEDDGKEADAMKREDAQGQDSETESQVRLEQQDSEVGNEKWNL